MSTRADIEKVMESVAAHLERYQPSRISSYELARVLKISVNTSRRACEELHAAGRIWRIDEDANHVKWQHAKRIRSLTTDKS